MHIKVVAALIEKDNKVLIAKHSIENFMYMENGHFLKKGRIK